MQAVNAIAIIICNALGNYFAVYALLYVGAVRPAYFADVDRIIENIANSAFCSRFTAPSINAEILQSLCDYGHSRTA